MPQTFTVPYSLSSVSFALPPGMVGELVQSKTMTPLRGDILKAAILDALSDPIASPPLRALAKPTDRVCIVVTDMTRSCPDDQLLPPLLRELELAGVPSEQVTILVGLGMHRATTQEERAKLLSSDVTQRYTVRDHEPQNPEALVNLGQVAWQVPAVLNRLAVEADLLIATGIVEPHQYAGFSGGRKTVAIGVAGEATIEYTHLPWALNHPKTRLGNLEGNPFHEAITEIAQKAGLKFICNVVADDDGEVVAVRAGEPAATFQELVDIAKALYLVPVDRQYDVVVAGVGYPKDVNLYQASRAASYLVFAPVPVVRKGGIIILPARCDEGPGQGIGERRFFNHLRNASSIAEIIHEAHEKGYKPGEQRAYVMARVLEHCQVIVAGSTCPQEVEQAHMLSAPDVDTALALCQQLLGRELRVLIIPRALLTLPLVQTPVTPAQ